MEISKSLRQIIIAELFVPVSLLTIGIYHGLMQTIYRAGCKRNSGSPMTSWSVMM